MRTRRRASAVQVELPSGDLYRARSVDEARRLLAPDHPAVRSGDRREARQLFAVTGLGLGLASAVVVAVFGLLHGWWAV